MCVCVYVCVWGGGGGMVCVLGGGGGVGGGTAHTPSIAFRHLPPNSVITGYTTEGELFTLAHLHRRCQGPPQGLDSNKTVEAT